MTATTILAINAPIATAVARQINFRLVLNCHLPTSMRKIKNCGGSQVPALVCHVCVKEELDTVLVEISVVPELFFIVIIMSRNPALGSVESIGVGIGC